MSTTRKGVTLYVVLPLYCLIAWYSIDFSLVSADPASDYQNYFSGFELASVESLRGFRLIAGWEPGFEVLLWLAAATGISFQAFLLTQSVFMLLAFHILSRKIVNNAGMAIIAVSLLAITPIFQSFSLVIIRQSLAVSFFFLFLSVLSDTNKFKAIIFASLSISMHSSATIFVAASLVPIFLGRNDKTITAAFVAMFILYCFDVSGSLFSGITAYIYEFVFSRDDMLTSDTYVTGAKSSFLIAVILAYAPSMYLQFHNAEDRVLRALRQTSMVLGIAFMAAADLPYHDRIAIAPFCLAPIFFVAFLRSVGGSMAAIAEK